MTIASPPHSDPTAVPPPGGSGAPEQEWVEQKWAALQQAAAVVAALAGVSADPLRSDLHDFPARMRTAHGWRLLLATQALDDLTAVMQPGIAALLQVHGRRADPAVAAQALWDEYESARAALLALVPRAH